MSGSDFTAWDMAKMWDLPNYVANLADLADYGVAPITVDEDAIASLLTGVSGMAGDAIERSSDESKTSKECGVCPNCGFELPKRSSEY